ncbi:ABC transporter substrate-binding protein [Micromonospora sp. KC213]|uniref:ABC transporter substrate-binding protein n=1 Tax=Micromonospora sp. KC213 TaxID=2530378 RepID=UPI0010454D02|nr:ABC transporter substrate-binding protein [Micromonospora sp. KC213]TDC38630.1 ABC transporter substrate-binding protein [Micromonospora sp. KC213]
MAGIRVKFGAAAVVAALLLAGCGDGNDGSDQPGSGTLRVATSALAASVDPMAELSASYLRSVGAAEGLMRIQPDGTVAPELAEKVEATAPTVWTATLRPNVTFWKGGTVDAKAVVASMERARTENTLAAGLLKDVTVAATGQRTVTFTTKEPTYSLPYALAHYQLVIHNVSGYPAGFSGTDPATADLTGPYRITGFESDRQMVLERNDRWWGGTPGLARVEVRKVADPQARAQIALSGQAEIVQDLPTERAKELEAAPGMSLVAKPAANTVTVYLNPTSTAAPALADQRVRQALAWAVDRQEVVSLATSGLSVPAPSWLASNPAFPDATGQGYTRFDKVTAERLLDEAGWTLGADGKRVKDGKKLTLRLLTFGAEAATGEVLQAQWARLGIDVQVRNVESSLINQSIEKGDWDAVTQAWTTLGDTAKLIAAQIGPGGAANHGKYTDPRIEGLLTQAAGAAQEGERTAAVYELNKLMVELAPSIPVHPRVLATGIAKEVTGFVAHPLQYENIVQPKMTLG